jgi:carboxymethylenebutenolidase
MRSLSAVVLLPLALAVGAAKPPAKAPPPESVSYRSGKETVRAVLCRPAGKGPFPAVVVVHGDFGLTKWVKEQAGRLAAKGYVALAIDLYRGEVAKDLEEAHILDRGLPENRALGDLKAAVDYLSALPGVNAECVGALGWDMGGGYALDAATRDRRLRAVVVCYGRLTTDAKLLAGLHAPVLGIFAAKDEGIPPETLKRFRAAMEKAGKRVAGLHIYPNCNTGFMDPASPYLTGPHPAAAVADAWSKIEGFFAGELKR